MKWIAPLLRKYSHLTVTMETGHEFELAAGVCDGQGSLGCCSPWRRKELDTTELLN